MSETLTEDPIDEVIPPPVDVSSDPPAEPPVEATTTDDAADPPPKPNRGDRRFANLTARNAAVEAELAAANRRAEAAEALLRAKGTDDPPPAQVNRETVEEAANRILAEREFAARRNAVVAAGKSAFGADEWTAKTEVLHSLGATGNPAFMEALVDLDNAPKLVAALADDTDALVALLSKPPVKMAAEMGRMAAKLETAPAAPAARQSNAPRPPAPVTAPAVAPEPDLYDPKLTMDQYVAQYNKLYGKKR